MRKCSVYCFTNLINNKKYIGSTIVEPNVRYNQHVYNSTHKNVHQYDYPLYQAFRKYGLENFQFEVLIQKECEEQEIREIEKEYILKYNTLSPNGYNQTLDTQHPINDIRSYQKMSETKRENAKKVAETNEGGTVIIKIYRSIADCADETGLDEKKIGACCRGERKRTQDRYFHFLDENQQIIINKYNRDEYKGAKGTTQKQITNRTVGKYDLKTDELLQEYESVALASRENNCDASGISKTCRGKRGHCGGFKWRYLDQ